MRGLERLEARRLLTAVVINEEVTDFGDSEFVDDVAVQKDDRILVLGHTENAADGDRLFLALYDVDGTLDPFFGIDGRVFGNFPEFRRASSMALDKSGRIIVAGVTNDPDPAVAAMRFTKAGFLDTSFGVNGLATLQAGSGEVVNDVAVDSSGRVVVVGQANFNTPSPTTPTPVFMVARFDTFGRADTTFGDETEDAAIDDGVNLFPVGVGESGATSVLIDGSRIFVAGFGTEQEAGQPAEKRFALTRLESDGTVDDDFGTGDGFVLVDVGLPSIAQELDLATNGKVVVVGNSTPTLDTPGEQILIARFDRGGALDNSFGGGDGLVVTGFAGARSQLARGVAVDNKDRILLAGEINDTGDPVGDLNDDRFVIARYLADGSPDTTFAPGGALIEEIRIGDSSVEQVAGIAIQRDGKDGRVIVAGNAGTTTTDQDIAVLRIATDAQQKSGNTRIKGKSLLVRGSDNADVIAVSANFSDNTIVVNVNGSVTTFPAANFTRIGIKGNDGDDEITCSVGGDVVSTLEGNDDDDELRLLGDARGRLEGGDDDDFIVGGDRDDRLKGGDDDDVLFGGDGHDDITGGDGFDELFGEDGDDDLKADDGFHDDVDGGDGDDDARIDFFDFVTRVDDLEVI